MPVCIVFEFSANAGAKDLVLEATPDPESTAIFPRMCAIQVEKVGAAMPCIYHADPTVRMFAVGIVVYKF